MSEKRFYLLNYNNHPIYDSLLDEEYNAQFKKQREKICDLLNALHEENIQFKKALIVAYNETKLTEQTKETIEKISELTGIDLE